jgi:hypothetical protein
MVTKHSVKGLKSSGSLLVLIWRENANMSNVKGGITYNINIISI